ncbi:MAG: hypothetical protein ABR559_08970 [Gemmatimonadota bacterium]
MSADARRAALLTCLWLAAAVLLGGLDLPAFGYGAFRFSLFGVVSGLLGIIYVFALSSRGVLWRGTGWLQPLLLVYWVAATAMMFRVLLPPPGLLQAVLAVTAAVAAGIIAGRNDRDGAAVWLGVVAVALAVLRFALVPAFSARSDLPNWGPFKIGAASNAFRDLFVSYAPERPAAQALHFAALVCFALGLWAQWDASERASTTGAQTGP